MARVLALSASEVDALSVKARGAGAQALRGLKVKVEGLIESRVKRAALASAQVTTTCSTVTTTVNLNGLVVRVKFNKGRVTLA